MNDTELVSAFQRCYSDAKAHTNDWRVESRELYAMFAGHQWSPEDLETLDNQKRPATTFNVAGKFLDALCGLQINNRQEIRYYPRQVGDTAINDLLTGAAKWLREECDAEDEESDAFQDTLVCGMGWTETDVEFETDPEGKLRVERRDPLLMYWDPSARKRNLEDMRWVIRVKPFSPAEFEQRWPDKLPSGAGGIEMGPGADIEGLLPHDATNAFRYDNQADGAPSQRRAIPVAEYQWYELEDAWHVQAPAPYGTRAFNKAEWAKVQPALDSQLVQYKASKGKRRRYYRAYFTGATLLDRGESPRQEGFTYLCITGKRDRNNATWYGMGRALKDPQRWTNAFFSSILYTLMSNAKGGLLAEEGAFSDPQKAEAEWARADSITYVADGAIAQGRVITKPQAPYPQGMDRLMEFSLRMLPETSGLNLEIIGMADRVQPGIVEAQRKQSALTVVAWAFDSMRRYYKAQGRLLEEYMREFLSDGRLVRVMGQEGEQYIPLVRDPQTARYDVVVDDAPTSVNLKERVWGVLTQLLPALLKMGVPIPPEILDYSPLPADLANKWKEAMKPDPAKQQMMAQQQALQMRGQTAEVSKTESEAELNKAKAAQAQAEAQVAPQKAVGEAKLTEQKTEHTRAQAIKTAAEAGAALAGSSPMMGGNGAGPTQ